MFDIGFSEILIIAVVALLVLGPERLPKAARLAGLWVRKARAQWYSVKAELERELLDEELKRSLKGSLDEVQQQMQSEQVQLRNEFRAIDESVKSPPPQPPADSEPPP
jgi:sec-independent protein translocase protein TatB